jgi:hypothetical protein
MIGQYCLNKKELKELMDLRVLEIAIEDEALAIRLEAAELWQEELSSLTYLLSHIVEGHKKRSDDSAEYVDAFYALEDQMLFKIQECDHPFIAYMLINKRNPSLSLEEELVELQVGMSEYRYGKTLRY